MIVTVIKPYKNKVLFTGKEHWTIMQQMLSYIMHYTKYGMVLLNFKQSGERNVRVSIISSYRDEMWRL